MTDQHPSRLPTAFIRVSRCPICRYSLRDLPEHRPCPECGALIDADLLTSPKMQDAVAATKTWCTLGILGWLIVAFGYWAVNMVSLSVMNSYYPGSYGPNHFAGVWCRTAFVIAPVALSCSWHRHARQNIYQIANRGTEHRARTPRRVIAVNLPGVLLGLFGCLGLVALVSAA